MHPQFQSCGGCLYIHVRISNRISRSMIPIVIILRYFHDFPAMNALSSKTNKITFLKGNPPGATRNHMEGFSDLCGERGSNLKEKQTTVFIFLGDRWEALGQLWGALGSIKGNFKRDFRKLLMMFLTFLRSARDRSRRHLTPTGRVGRGEGRMSNDMRISF